MKIKITKYPLRGDLTKIRDGKFWTCPDGHMQPKGRLTCIDCAMEHAIKYGRKRK